MASVGERRVIQLAARQFGVMSWQDLVAARISRAWLVRRLRIGELSQIHRGVFKFGAQACTQDQLDMAALLRAGEGAALSHFSAARKLGLDAPREPSVHVTIPLSREALGVFGITVWRSRDLVPSDITQRGPFRVTNLARTMIDLAGVLDDRWLRAALDSALRKRNRYLQWLYRVIRERGVGHRGVARLRALLDEYQRGDEVPDSALESFAMELAIATGRRPKLHWNVVEGAHHMAELDLAWPEVRLGAEVDGWMRHGTRDAFEEDRARDRSLVAHGWAVLRYTWRQVMDDRHRIVAELAQTYEARLSGSASRPRGKVAKARALLPGPSSGLRMSS